MRHATILSALLGLALSACKFAELPPIDPDAAGTQDDAASPDGSDGDGGLDANVDAADAGPDAAPLRWSAPVSLAFNTTDLTEAQPSASPSGVELFFSGNPNTSTFVLDVYLVSRATTTDAWGSVRTPVAAVNTTQTEADPNISADGLELVFRRAGDIWSVRRSAVGAAWGTPAMTGLVGQFPNLLTDGLNMYYQPTGVSCPVATCRTRVSRSSTSSAWGSPIQEQFPPGGYQAVYISGDGLRALLSSPSMTTVSPIAISRRSSLSAAWGPAEPVLELANYTAMKNARWNWNETEMYFSASQATDDLYMSRLQP